MCSRLTNYFDGLKFTGKKEDILFDQIPELIFFLIWGQSYKLNRAKKKWEEKEDNKYLDSTNDIDKVTIFLYVKSVNTKIFYNL